MGKIYDFDEIIERKNTDSLKYDFAVERGMPADILPMWVADMDFRTPDEVIAALSKRSEHGIFGYTETKTDYFEAIAGWMKRRHGWSIKEEWLVKTPSIVFAIAMAIRACTKPGEGVLIQQPVYYPFADIIRKNNRTLVSNDLVLDNGHYIIDFDDFEKKIKENQVKLFVLCSPHNPVGRVWSEEELRKMGDICLQNNVVILSDEIHSDFIYSGHKHIPFAGIKDKFEQNCIVCTSPSKTFNLAGLQVSNILIPNEKIREAFACEVDASGYSQIGTMGIEGCKAAYTYGDEWLTQLISYLEKNLHFVREFVKTHLPGVELIEPEGTYLLWLDFRGLGLNCEELEDFIANKAQLWLDGGYIFGPTGEGFQRFNIATPKAILESAFLKLENAIKEL